MSHYKLRIKKNDMRAIMHEYFPDVEDDVSLQDMKFSHHGHVYRLRFHQDGGPGHYDLVVDDSLGAPVAVLVGPGPGCESGRRVAHPSPRWLLETGCMERVCQ